VEVSLIPRRNQIRSVADVILDRQAKSLSLLAEKHFSISETAAALRVDKSTVRKWCHVGEIAFCRTGKLGRIRIPESELQRLLGKGQP
jgi:excisionase family DNA binding protein